MIRKWVRIKTSGSKMPNMWNISENRNTEPAPLMSLYQYLIEALLLTSMEVAVLIAGSDIK